MTVVVTLNYSRVCASQQGSQGPLFLPVLIPVIGVTGSNWVSTLSGVFEECGLSLDSYIQGPLLRPPSRKVPGVYASEASLRASAERCWGEFLEASWKHPVEERWLIHLIRRKLRRWVGRPSTAWRILTELCWADTVHLPPARLQCILGTFQSSLFLCSARSFVRFNMQSSCQMLLVPPDEDSYEHRFPDVKAEILKSPISLFYGSYQY